MAVTEIGEYSYLLSPAEVIKIADDKKIGVISSADFHKLNAISDLPDKSLILFQDYHSDNVKMGHYCALIKSNVCKVPYKKEPKPQLFFYDSYGQYPTSQLDNIHKEYRRKTQQVENHLAKMILDSDYELHYNPYHHQGLRKIMGEDVNTCGRHCGYFMRMNKYANFDPEEYNSFLLTIHEANLRYYPNYEAITKDLGKNNRDVLITQLTTEILLN